MARVISIGDAHIDIDEGESILTEYSHKYTLASFAKMAERAGFEVRKVWIDANELFSVHYCVTT